MLTVSMKMLFPFQSGSSVAISIEIGARRYRQVKAALLE
jgi:hypothetical protein